MLDVKCQESTLSFAKNSQNRVVIVPCPQKHFGIGKCKSRALLFCDIINKMLL
jgi:hypothetical protein